jgi:dihydropteroate synthase
MAYGAAKYDVPIVVMHNQDGTEYGRPFMDEMIRFFEHTLRLPIRRVCPEKSDLDPGVASAKDFEQKSGNHAEFAQLREMGYPYCWEPHVTHVGYAS